MHLLLSLTGLVSLLIWIYLSAFRGGFWRCEERLQSRPVARDRWPAVCAIVPARNEAEVIAASLRSLLEQDYPGHLRVVLIDDHSDDGTEQTARDAAARSRHPERFTVLKAAALPSGWTGKLWALHHGVQHSDDRIDFVWFSDADIEQPPQALRQMVEKAQDENRDLVSQMVVLRCENVWERLLIPPFVYFFQKLYPFSWVKDPQKTTAAAAGGCILLRRAVLQQIGGLAAIRDALIDDCALARVVKAAREAGSNGIWLGLATGARSIRPYAGLTDIWAMVARTAFTQLNHSALLLCATLFGMFMTYLAPPLLLITYPWHQQPAAALLAGCAWALMSLSLIPTLKLYGQPFWFAPLLPLAAVLYSAMTFDSAWRHWRGMGGHWKGRVQGSG